eukprot:scaffold34930_cov191-Amphora_coffeaeformis.AAC.6
MSINNSNTIVSANRPLGYHLYSNDTPQQPLGPKYSTACIVEETIGDRRLGARVLAGLDLILPLLLNDDVLSLAKLLHVFPAGRPFDASCSNEMLPIPTSDFLSDFASGTASESHHRHGQGVTWPHVPRNHTTLANIVGVALPEVAPSSSPPPLQWTREGAVPMSSEWKDAWIGLCGEWKEQLAALQQRDDVSSSSSILVYLYARLAYDVGQILGTMHQHEISWGTYQDDMCRKALDEWQCNAHANNLVVIPPPRPDTTAATTESLLAFLDMDMAFDKESFISNNNDHPGMFDHILWLEHISMMEGLAGNDTSTGVPQIALLHKQQQRMSFGP